MCQIFGTLIADEQHIYDLNSLDDQLVLGIKGTLSVVELKVLRQRMQAGQESKARRGELFKRLPIGYVLDELGKVAFHPDRRVSKPCNWSSSNSGSCGACVKRSYGFGITMWSYQPTQYMEHGSFGRSRHIA